LWLVISVVFRPAFIRTMMLAARPLTSVTQRFEFHFARPFGHFQFRIAAV
jgi:hypothetical protein